jgi:hypothetical protein
LFDLDYTTKRGAARKIFNVIPYPKQSIAEPDTGFAANTKLAKPAGRGHLRGANRLKDSS